MFPQISRMPNFEYKVSGKTYKMSTHCFIRDNQLEFVSQTDTEITFMYQHSEKSLEMYPYAFIFTLLTN